MFWFFLLLFPFRQISNGHSRLRRSFVKRRTGNGGEMSRRKISKSINSTKGKKEPRIRWTIEFLRPVFLSSDSFFLRLSSFSFFFFLFPYSLISLPHFSHFLYYQFWGSGKKGQWKSLAGYQARGLNEDELGKRPSVVNFANNVG